jgi:hypothetical protein
MSKLSEEEANNVSGDEIKSSMISLHRSSGSHQTINPLNLKKHWTINSYVLVGDEIVLIKCNPLAPFRSKLKLY